MKTHQLKSRTIFKSLGIIMIFSLVLSFNPVFGQTIENSTAENTNQERIISGTVTDEDGPFVGANVILKGTRIGTSTDENGEFTFPRPLNNGDVLQFTYIGYDTQELEITPSIEKINMVMSMNSISIMEALQTNKPYKSKRKKKN